MMIHSVATMEKITEDVDEDEEEEAGDHGEYERRRRILIVEAGRIFCCRGENNNRTTVVCDVVNRWKDGQTDKALIIIELFEESLFFAISLFGSHTNCFMAVNPIFSDSTTNRFRFSATYSPLYTLYCTLYCTLYTLYTLYFLQHIHP